MTSDVLIVAGAVFAVVGAFDAWRPLGFFVLAAVLVVASMIFGARKAGP